MTNFPDHFSQVSQKYQQFRPVYPIKLIEFLGEVAPHKECVWDCATGTGQVARALAPLFKRVIATDASAKQIEAAEAFENVEFRVAAAESSGIESGSIDLVTVGQALHWFSWASFYSEVDRILKPNGVLAAWTYSLMRISPEVDAIILEFYRDFLGPYWPKERQLVDLGYRTIPFPYARIQAPTFSMEADWNFEALLGYLSTWSAVSKYRDQHHIDPLQSFMKPLQEAWADLEQRRVTWPLSLLVGRKSA